MRKKLAVAVVLLLLSALAIRWFLRPTPMDPGTPRAQLPDTVTPLAYTLRLQIDPDKDLFNGHVDIRAQLNHETQRIWMHGRALTMDKVTVRAADGSTLEAHYREQGESGVVALDLERPLSAQTIVLSFDYHAEFGATLDGLYKVEDGGQQYAFTQFESIAARKVFPSFDEPRFKVPFDLSVIARADHKVIANTELVAQSARDDGLIEYRFATTPPLPTYLLALAVGDLDVVEATPIPASAIRATPVPLRGIATKGKGPQLQYALEHTASIVQSLENYFGIAYPYGKLDLLAVPDFEAGAMENAGAITFREQTLLLDEQSSLEQKREYFVTNAHELAHQWFGNLVTMRWWNDIWLNEAFATWMENKMAESLAGDLGFDLLSQQNAAEAMEPDTLQSMREIRQPILDNADIDNAFDSITYSKGAAVIAMFERFVGAEKFRLGVQHYISDHAYGNADAEDFIAAISTASAEPRLRTAFSSFLTQAGIPDVAMHWSCKDGQVSAELQQQRYHPLGAGPAKPQQWQIPFCVSAHDGKQSLTQCTLLTETSAHWQFEQAHCPQWIMPNADGAGYYRFHLEREQWQQLLPHMQEMGNAEAYTLAENYAAALRSGAIDVNDYLAQVRRIVAYPHHAVKALPMSSLDLIRDYLVAKADREKLQRYFQSLYAKDWQTLGLQASDAETPEASMLRNSVLNFMAESAQDRELRAHLAQMARDYIGYGSDDQLHEDAADADLIDLALIIASQDGDQDFFHALQKQFRHSNDGNVREMLLTAIARNHTPELADEARNMITDLDLRTNERIDILYQQIYDPALAADAFGWVKNKFRLLQPLLPEGVLKHAPSIGDRFCSDAQATDLRKFFAPKLADVRGAESNLNITLESIRLCAAFVRAQPSIRWDKLSENGIN